MTYLGFLKYKDVFKFDGNVYKAGHVDNEEDYVYCTDMATHKVKKIHIDSEVEKVEEEALNDIL